MNRIELSGDVRVYDERGAMESLVGNVRQAAEAARFGQQRQVQLRLHDAIEAAVQLGTHLSDGRWARVAAILDQARDRLVKVHPATFRSPQFRQATADGLANILLTLELVRHGPTRH